MTYLITVLLTCALTTVDSENASAPEGHRSPPMLEKPQTTKVELPDLLDDKHIVEDPAELLKTLLETQQKAWDELETVKVRAWYRFHAHRGSKPVTWLIDYASSNKSEYSKELSFASNKMMVEAKAGRQYDPVGVDAADKDAWYCRVAEIVSPDAIVKAMFTKHMRPDSIEMVTIFPADKVTRRGAEEKIRPFGFAMPPQQFFDVELPRMLKAGGTLVVRRDDTLVELDIINPKDRRAPRKIYRFDLSKSGNAVVTYNRSHRRETKFQKIENVWVPVSLSEQNMNRYVEMNFFDWSINADMDLGDFSVKSLPISDHTVVKDKRVTPTAQTFFRDWSE